MNSPFSSSSVFGDRLDSQSRKFNIDGLVKSPFAALRFTFVVAAYQQVRFTPQVLRALSRLGGRASYETIFRDFLRDHQYLPRISSVNQKILLPIAPKNRNSQKIAHNFIAEFA